MRWRYLGLSGLTIISVLPLLAFGEMLSSVPPGTGGDRQGGEGLEQQMRMLTTFAAYFFFVLGTLVWWFCAVSRKYRRGWCYLSGILISLPPLALCGWELIVAVLYWVQNALVLIAGCMLLILLILTYAVFLDIRWLKTNKH